MSNNKVLLMILDGWGWILAGCRQVIEVVRSGMAKGEVSVTAVASKLNMGEQTFRRRFVCETGQQPKMFITAIQMDLAARLLLQDSSRPVGASYPEATGGWP